MRRAAWAKLPGMSKDLIAHIASGIQAHHARAGSPLGFEEYLALLVAEPALHCRGAAEYLRDTFDFFGSQEISTPAGKLRRFALFDQAFAGGLGRVAGQEEAQNSIYRLLNNFVRVGRVNRLILLHGPNGSAKTSLIRAMARGLEHYSSQAAGALYHFRWVFPSSRFTHSHIGFGQKVGADLPAAPASFAHLPPEDVDAVLACDLHDHPLLLIPPQERLRLLERLREEGRLPADAVLPEALLRGDLCPRCRQIHDALLSAYDGNALDVLRHVQVQRFRFSLRYRQGISVVEPQLHVDASEKQVTASRGLAALPPAVSHLDLFELGGPLVDANRGLLEYNDLLKRPIDTFKYLLVTCESGQVTLDRSSLFLDTVFIGSTNEMLLDSFKGYADFASFKGRLELVRVPYLRRVSEEVQIYRDQISEPILDRHLAPHTLYLASLWAVLTRLRPIEVDGLTGELKSALQSLNPLEKAHLYDSGEPPPRFSSALAREIQAHVPEAFAQPGQDYEGRSGASAREVRMLLLNAAQRPERKCLTPLGLFEEIAELMRDRTVFEFLQRKPDGEYGDMERLLHRVREEYLELLEDEAAEALGLVTSASYRDLFNRYVQHVSHWLRKEKLQDPVTGQPVPPDEEMMKEVEAVVRPADEDSAVFRRNLISRIGAFALDAGRAGQGGTALDYARVFPEIFGRLKDDFMKKRRATIQRAYQNFLRLQGGEALEARDEQQATRMRDTLIRERGYCIDCAQEAVAYLLKHRYQSED
ncbi:MAG: serine protein kinase PrkA [Myxococcales bacterium]|nr:serine protein kinase PrkA [Myxococcales bacterium]